MFDILLILAQQSAEVDVDLTLPGILALGAGVLILVAPRILNYVVATYLIVVGVIQIFDITIQ